MVDDILEFSSINLPLNTEVTQCVQGVLFYQLRYARILFKISVCMYSSKVSLIFLFYNVFAKFCIIILALMNEFMSSVFSLLHKSFQKLDLWVSKKMVKFACNNI